MLVTTINSISIRLIIIMTHPALPVIPTQDLGTSQLSSQTTSQAINSLSRRPAKRDGLLVLVEVPGGYGYMPLRVRSATFSKQKRSRSISNQGSTGLGNISDFGEGAELRSSSVDLFDSERSSSGKKDGKR